MAVLAFSAGNVLVWIVWLAAAFACLGSGVAVISFTNPFFSALALIGILGPEVSWYLAVAAFLFATGALGVLLRRSPLIVLLSLEIMLNGANLALIALARQQGDHDGQIFALAVMAVAASEVVVGLGLIVAMGRRRLELDVDRIGALIIWYSVGYMDGSDEERRFFAYMSLFVFSMLLLVQGGNLLMLLAGWGLVGLSSYLLIGYHHERPSAVAAAKKAFVMNAVGDATMALSLFLLIQRIGSLEFAAGFYLLVRTAPVFEAAPHVQDLAAGLGAFTLVLAGLIALVQVDIKRVIAYSTMSQIGYMFLGAGLGAYANGMFHLMTHAFFKALLFLAAGIVIHALAGEQDMRRMGGLRTLMPGAWIAFWIGGLALAGVPPFSGFFSKDSILAAALDHGWYGVVLWVAGMAGGVLPGVFTFPVVFIVFGGERSAYVQEHPPHVPEEAIPRRSMTWAVAVLALLATGGGWIQFAGIWTP